MWGLIQNERLHVVQVFGFAGLLPYLMSFPREGKYIPLPQRVREGPRGGVRCSGSRGGRPGLSSLPPRGPHHLDNSSPGPGSEARGINGGRYDIYFWQKKVGRMISRILSVCQDDVSMFL